jgi:hypothetical protein
VGTWRKRGKRWRRGRWRRSRAGEWGEEDLPSSSSPSNSSASLRRLLALLAGEVFTSGGEGGDGIVGDGGALFSGVASSQVEAATSSEGGGKQSRLPLAAVAARPRCLRRRRRPAVAAIVVEAGRMHINVIVCEPAAWLTATCALRPLSMQRPYSAKKSATEADGGVFLGLAGSPTQVASPPLTTLAHVGEAREVGGVWRRMGQLTSSLPGWLAYDPCGGGGGVAGG